MAAVSGAAAARDTESGSAGVFTRAAPLSALLTWASTSAKYNRFEPTLHALAINFFLEAQAQ